MYREQKPRAWEFRAYMDFTAFKNGDLLSIEFPELREDEHIVSEAMYIGEDLEHVYLYEMVSADELVTSSICSTLTVSDCAELYHANDAFIIQLRKDHFDKQLYWGKAYVTLTLP